MTSLFEDHLSLDAVVAYADGEMGMVAFQRAAAHVARCPRCAAEVSEQTFARDQLRSAQTPRMPGSLFDQLRSIPVALPASPRVPGIDLDTGTGSAVHTDHRNAHRSRRFRMGAGFLIAGIAVTALAATAGSERPARPGVPFATPGGAPTSVMVQASVAERVSHRPR